MCSQWLHGPAWLGKYAKNPYAEVVPSLTSEQQLLEVKSVACLAPTNPPCQTLFSRCSSLQEALTLVGWAMRFKTNCQLSATKSPKISGPLHPDELLKAQTSLWKGIQREHYSLEVRLLAKGKKLPLSSQLCKLGPFIDEQGLLRIKGRLQNAEIADDTKHPISMPKCHISTLLVRFQHIFLKHAGVKSMVTSLMEKFHIFGVVKLAKSAHKKVYKLPKTGF